MQYSQHKCHIHMSIPLLYDDIMPFQPATARIALLAFYRMPMPFQPATARIALLAYYRMPMHMSIVHMF
jgi:hypothetical protein